jgi:hypothetical protein
MVTQNVQPSMKNVDVAASYEDVDGSESERDEHQPWTDELENRDYEGQEDEGQEDEGEEDEWHSETQSKDEFELQRLKALSSIIALSQRTNT